MIEFFEKLNTNEPNSFLFRNEWWKLKYPSDFMMDYSLDKIDSLEIKLEKKK